MTSVLVTGGTGQLGRRVVGALLDDGRPVRVLSRRPAGSPVPSADVDGTGRLLDAARSAGRPHVVPVSIVGLDRIPAEYYDLLDGRSPSRLQEA